MKIAAKTLTVYGQSGQNVIGTLACGDAVKVLGENANGVLIAYITWLVKTVEAQALISPEQWEQAVDEKQKFLSFIAAQVGALYVWGAQGQQMTPVLIKKLENSDTGYRRALAKYEAHVKAGLTLIAYDCSGLVVAHLLGAGLIPRDMSANGLYRDACDDISKTALTAGDLVFKMYTSGENKGRKYHVGVYMGDGTVVHAKGRDHGVVREPFAAEKWNCFGRLRGLGNAATATYTRALKNTGRPYMTGDDVRAAQSALERSGFSPGGIDGVYGPKTETAVKAYQKARKLTVDGIVGPKTWAALMR